ncbi:LysR family transcriptional regulator [Myroides sp. JBRI-B21084]|uniref:LysR family transcriptional regulator n=1 Tax=Myroides sp. JBRI-B21084 TaxID=3119977 RepID=UPI0026E1A5E5|nr:LysR family transcriptional regulator [Paenimyroides cloacae]WKW46890.1 LysR family transcriptional regulator [Paenimyroides cloacae]
MELRQLKYFLKAKEFLNFTEAANNLHISQSTLSQQIKQLEDELDVLLFNRIGKRITLTEAGELFAEYALQSVNRANDGFLLLKDLNNLHTGKISIGATYGLRNLLTKALIQFAEQFPKINVQIFFGTSNELIEKLNHFQLDFVLTFNETTKEQDFKYQTLFSSPMTLVTSKKSILANKTSITLKEIAELPLAIPASGYSTIQFMNEAFRKNNLKPNIRIEINDVPTIFELVKTGNWHTFMSGASVNDKGLSTILIKGKNMSRTAMIISLKNAYEKKAVKKFYELLTEN